MTFWLVCCEGRAQAQSASSRLRLRKGAGVAGDLLYWFSLPSGSATKHHALPVEDKDGWIALEVPQEYQAADAQLNLLNVSQGRVAHLALNGPNKRFALGIGNREMVMASEIMGYDQGAAVFAIRRRSSAAGTAGWRPGSGMRSRSHRRR